MKIDIIKLIQKKLKIVICAAIIILSPLVYFVLYAPIIKKITASYLEYKFYDAEIYNAQHIIDHTVKMREGATFITEKEAPAAIDELIGYGKAKGIVFVSVKPMEIRQGKDPDYRILPIAIVLELDKGQFSDFLNSLELAKKILITIEKFELIRDIKFKTKFNVSITIDMYLAG